MITKGRDDWEQHKLDLYEKFKEYDEKAAKEFIEYYSKVWEPFGYQLLDYHICWRLWDNMRIVQRTGVKWYAIVGAGGLGKTWLSWKIAYFLDPKFTLDSCCLTLKEFVLKMKELSADKMRAVVLDEPDINMAAQSKEGQLFANIIGQARQEKMFMIYNATDLAYIPNYIFRKITGLFWCANLGEVYFFEDRPKEYRYTLSEIKWEYYKKKWYSFVERMKSPGCIPFRTAEKVPFNEEDIGKYLIRKKSRIKDSYEIFINKGEPLNRRELALSWYKLGQSTKEIAQKLKCTKRNVEILLENKV
jgi:hypothetical protein